MSSLVSLFVQDSSIPLDFNRWQEKNWLGHKKTFHNAALVKVLNNPQKGFIKSPLLSLSHLTNDKCTFRVSRMVSYDQEFPFNDYFRECSGLLCNDPWLL